VDEVLTLSDCWPTEIDVSAKLCPNYDGAAVKNVQARANVSVTMTSVNRQLMQVVTEQKIQNV